MSPSTRTIVPAQVKRHVVGTPMSADTLVYEEKVDGWFVDIDRSQSGDFAFIGISDHETSEAYVLPCDDYTMPAPPDRAARHRASGTTSITTAIVS